MNVHMNSQSRTGERMTGNQMLRHAQLTSYTANLIFKQQSQGFAQFQVHFFRKSTYIMMTLDYSSGIRKRLDAVWIDRSLSQPFHIFNLMSLFIEYINETLTYNLTLLIRWKERKCGVYNSIRKYSIARTVHRC